MKTRLLSSGEFCKLRYDTIPVKNAYANVSFYINNSKMPDFVLWHSCRKWAIRHLKNKNIIKLFFLYRVELGYVIEKTQKFCGYKQKSL